MGEEEKEFPGWWWKDIPEYSHTLGIEDCESRLGQVRKLQEKLTQQDETAYLMKQHWGQFNKWQEV